MSTGSIIEGRDVRSVVSSFAVGAEKRAQPLSLRTLSTLLLACTSPFAVMSASERAEMVYECIRGGAEEYLIKPVTRKEVQNIWTHIIRRLNNTPTAGAAALPPAHPVANGTTLPDISAAATAAGAPAVAALPAPSPSQQQQQAGIEAGATTAAPPPLPLLPLAPQQLVPPTPCTSHGAHPVQQTIPSPLSPSGIAPMQQQQQQQLASALSLAAAATSNQHPWHALAQQYANGAGATHAAVAGQQLQAEGRHGSQPPHAKRLRRHGGGSGHTLLSAGSEGPGARALGGGIGGAGAGGEQLGGTQGGMMVEAAGRAEREAGPQGAPLFGGFGGASASGDTASIIPLSSWLARPNRVVQPKESFWIFTEVCVRVCGCVGGCVRACMHPSRAVGLSRGARWRVAPAHVRSCICPRLPWTGPPVYQHARECALG